MDKEGVSWKLVFEWLVYGIICWVRVNEMKTEDCL